MKILKTKPLIRLVDTWIGPLFHYGCTLIEIEGENHDTSNIRNER